MADGDCIAQLGGWVGDRVEAWWHEQRGERRWLAVKLRPAPGEVRRCSGCGEVVAAIHDRTLRRIRDLPVSGPRSSCTSSACDWLVRVAGRGWSALSGWIPIAG